MLWQCTNGNIAFPLALSASLLKEMYLSETEELFRPQKRQSDVNETKHRSEGNPGFYVVSILKYFLDKASICLPLCIYVLKTAVHLSSLHALLFFYLLAWNSKPDAPYTILTAEPSVSSMVSSHVLFFRFWDAFIFWLAWNFGQHTLYIEELSEERVNKATNDLCYLV